VASGRAPFFPLRLGRGWLRCTVCRTRELVFRRAPLSPSACAAHRVRSARTKHRACRCLKSHVTPTASAVADVGLGSDRGLKTLDVDGIVRTSRAKGRGYDIFFKHCAGATGGTYSDAPVGRNCPTCSSLRSMPVRRALSLSRRAPSPASCAQCRDRTARRQSLRRAPRTIPPRQPVSVGVNSFGARAARWRS